MVIGIILSLLLLCLDAMLIRWLITLLPDLGQWKGVIWVIGIWFTSPIYILPALLAWLKKGIWYE